MIYIFFINPPLVVVAVDDFFVFVVVVFFLIFATPYRSLIHLFQRVCTKFYALFDARYLHIISCVKCVK